MSKIDYYTYLKSPEWLNIRLDFITNMDYTCQRCSQRYENSLGLLHVHHLHYRSLGAEESEDLELLCKGCHAREHGITSKGKRGSKKRKFIKNKRAYKTRPKKSKQTDLKPKRDKAIKVKLPLKIYSGQKVNITRVFETYKRHGLNVKVEIRDEKYKVIYLAGPIERFIRLSTECYQGEIVNGNQRQPVTYCIVLSENAVKHVRLKRPEKFMQQ